jgi:hypothetical protein
MRKVRTHWFNGVRYDIEISPGCKLEGMCDDPEDPTPSIRVYKDLNTKAGFETLIHESLHAAKWGLSEEDVTRMACEMTDLAWRLGYRMSTTKKGW